MPPEALIAWKWELTSDWVGEGDKNRQWLEWGLQPPQGMGTPGQARQRLKGERFPLLSPEGASHICGTTRFAGDTAGWSLASQDILPPVLALTEPCVPRTVSG